MYNSAARQLLGRPIPAGKPDSWAETFGLRTPTAAGSTTTRCARPCRVGERRPTPRPSRCAVGQGDAARILDISAQPLGDRRGALDDGPAPRRHRPAGAAARADQLRRHGRPRPARPADRARRLARGRRGRDAAATAFVVDDALAQGARGQPADAPGDRGLAELHRRPERPAAPRGGRARRGRQRDRGEPPGQLGRRRRAAVPARPRHSVDADPGLLRQLLDNLVGNAVKYTAPDEAPWSAQLRPRTRSRAGSGSTSSTAASASPEGRGGADLRGVPPRPGRGALPGHRPRPGAHPAHRGAARRRS